VQVTSGVEPGERVITVGGVGLEDGAKVRVKDTKETKDSKADGR